MPNIFKGIHLYSPFVFACKKCKNSALLHWSTNKILLYSTVLLNLSRCVLWKSLEDRVVPARQVT